MSWARRIAVALAILLVVLGPALAACVRPAPHLGPVPATRTEFAPVEEPYRIQAGDELEVRFFHTPEQNVTLPVRPDGFISLPLAYELRAAGRTVEDLRRELVERYSAELSAPEIAVIVRSFSSYHVHVGGEVGNPGVIELTGPSTVLEAVFAAGGFLSTASPADALVVRRGSEGGYELLAADLERLLGGQSADGNVRLRPFDVVYVPSSAIADVNRWVDQYIRKNVPISFSYRLDTGN